MTRKKIVEPVKIIKPIKHARFYVQAGNPNPIGYRCNGLEIRRKLGETVEELRTRCRNSVDWPTPDTMRVFIPLNN